MEELNKTQLILLALLVSFVTSIATGIVTVALMDQAPPAITQTINRVIKETERIIVPEKQQATVETVVVKEEDYIVSAVDANAPNVVSIAALSKPKSRLGFVSATDTRRVVSVLGMGVALTKDGVIILPDAFLGKGEEFAVGTRSGKFFLFSVMTHDMASGLALARIGSEILPADPDPADAENKSASTGDTILDLAKKADATSILGFGELKFASTKEIKLGQTAVAVGFFGGNPRISLGTVSGIGMGKEQNATLIYTTINIGGEWNGSPLLDSAGRLVGVTLLGTDGGHSAIPAEVAKALLDGVIAGETKKEVPKEPSA